MSEVTSHPFLLALVAIVLLFIAGSELGRVLRQRRREQSTRHPVHAWTPWHWTPDGYMRFCKLCAAAQYGGDDYDAGPDEFGMVAFR